MTAPISSNRSMYDAAAQVSAADTCDPSVMSCASGSAGESVSQRASVDLEPVYVTGTVGTTKLVSEYDRSQNRSRCGIETDNAVLTCAAARTATVAGAAATATVVGAGVVGTVVVAGTICGRDLRALYNCKTQQ